MTKPVVGFIAGRTAPAGKRMGHAGAVISGGGDTAEAKMAIMRDAGILVCESPSTLGKAMKELLSGKTPRALKDAAKPVAKEAAKPVAKRAAKPVAKAVRKGGKPAAGKAAGPRGAARKNPSRR
jgi:succinyl-CoA synthetase alpha subunit